MGWQLNRSTCCAKSMQLLKQPWHLREPHTAVILHFCEGMVDETKANIRHTGPNTPIIP